MSDPVLKITLAFSLLLHAAFGLWVEVHGSARSRMRPVVDSWSGPGIEVDSVVTESRSASSEDQARASAATEQSSPPNPAPVAPPASETDAAPAAVLVPKPSPAPRVTPAHAPLQAAQRAARPSSSSAPDARANASASAASTPASDGTASSTSPASGAFGAAGLPVGVRHLPKAFTRALGIASRGDPRWTMLPAGPVGEARFHLSVGEDGQLGEVEYDAPRSANELPDVLRHLLENIHTLLMSGRYSLDAKDLQAGVERLRVRVEITERPADGDPELDPSGLNELDYEAPNGHKPGRGSFRLNSGRRVIGWVYVE